MPEAGDHYYQVKWKGFSELTWEPSANLSHLKSMLDAFNKSLEAALVTDTPCKSKVSTPVAGVNDDIPTTQEEYKSVPPPGKRLKKFTPDSGSKVELISSAVKGSTK